MTNIIRLPKLGQHLCFLGKTGSGKSKLAEKMIAGLLYKYPSTREFTIDTDDSVEIKGAKTCTSPRQVKIWFNFISKIRYVPKFKYLDRDVWDDLIQWLCATSSMKNPKPLIIHINEIYRLGYGADFPRALPIAMATARKKQISMLIETQRPKAIPIPVLTESSKIFVWKLNRADDRKYIAGYVGGGRENEKNFIDVLSRQKKDYSFIEIDTDSGEFTKFPPLKL